MSDELFLTLTAPDGTNARTIAGWNSVRVTAGIETVPRTFDIGFTDISSDDMDALPVAPGDVCQVYLGEDLVLTGYVDSDYPQVDATSHFESITGRGKCCDLIDCAAVWPGGQISSASALVIAQQLAAYYNIPVSLDPSIGELPPILQMNLMQGESPWDLIERVCRWSALLAYDLPDGSLYLTRADKAARHASGATYGVNVKAAGAVFSAADRFSEYVVFLQSVDVLHEMGDGGNQLAIAQDAAVLRPRRRVIIAEAANGGPSIAMQRANWERLRRAGRSSSIRVVVDSWRDAAGTLWTPNQIVPVEVPKVRVGTKGKPEDWLLASVTFIRDEGGTSAELTLMPPDAFRVEPTLQLPAIPDVAFGNDGH